MIQTRLLLIATLINVASSKSLSITEVAESIIRREFHAPTISVILDSTKKCDTSSFPPRIERNDENLLMQRLQTNYAVEVQTSDTLCLETEYVVKSQQILIIVSGRASSVGVKISVKNWKNARGWHGRAKILIVLLCDLAKNATEFIEHVWKHTKSATAAVLQEEHNGQVNLYTWNPFGESCLLEISKITAAEYEKQSTGIYDTGKSIRNLHRCRLVVATADQLPYMYSNSYGVYWTGIEFEIFRILAEVINFTPAFIGPLPGESIWESEIDGKPVGFFKRLTEQEADILFYGLGVTKQRALDSDFIVYNQESFVFASPLPKKIPTWKIQFLVFDSKTWLYLSVSTIAMTIVLKLLTKRRLGRSIITSILLFLNMADHRLTAIQKTSIRIFLTFWFLYALNTSAAFQAGMFSAMTEGIPTHAVETAMGMAKLGYVFNIYPEAREHFQNGMRDLYDYLISNHLLNWTGDGMASMREAAFQRQVALVDECTAKYYSYLMYKTDDNQPYMRILKERFGSYSVAFYMYKDHPLTPSVAIIIRRLIEHGFVQIYIDTFMGNALKDRSYALSEQLHSELHYFEDTHQAVQLKQLLGPLATYVILTVASIFVFVGETLISRVQNACVPTRAPRLRNATLARLEIN